MEKARKVGFQANRDNFAHRKHATEVLMREHRVIDSDLFDYVTIGWLQNYLRANHVTFRKSDTKPRLVSLVQSTLKPSKKVIVASSCTDLMKRVTQSYRRKKILPPKERVEQFVAKTLQRSRKSMSRTMSDKIWTRLHSRKLPSLPKSPSPSPNSPPKTPIRPKTPSPRKSPIRPKTSPRPKTPSPRKSSSRLKTPRSPKGINLQEDKEDVAYIDFVRDQEAIRSELDSTYESALATFQGIPEPSQEDEDEFIDFLREEISRILRESKINPGKEYLEGLASDILSPFGYDQMEIEKLVDEWVTVLKEANLQEMEQKYQHVQAFSEEEEKFYDRVRKLAKESKALSEFAKAFRVLWTEAGKPGIDRELVMHDLMDRGISEEKATRLLAKYPER